MLVYFVLVVVVFAFKGLKTTVVTLVLEMFQMHYNAFGRLQK